MRYSLLARLLIGCGGSDAAVDDGTSAPDRGDATTNPAPDGGASPGDAALTADASTTPADDRIDPISLNRSWTYDVSVIGTYPLCRAGSSTAQVPPRARPPRPYRDDRELRDRDERHP